MNKIDYVPPVKEYQKRLSTYSNAPALPVWPYDKNCENSSPPFAPKADLTLTGINYGGWDSHIQTNRRCTPSTYTHRAYTPSIKVSR